MTFDELLTLVSSDARPGIRTDSRLVGSGDIFIAVEGSAFDGHDFIEQAIANGAQIVVCQSDHEARITGGLSSTCRIIGVENSARAVGLLAQAAYGRPAASLTNLAVTGTNGKTTVAFLVQACLQHAGHRCGLLGTVLYDTGAGLKPAPLTTPDALAIAELQAEMVRAGATYMVAEASSHALSQDRLAGIEFTAAAFTNLTGDHLDYHKTEQDYLAAKARLFTALSPEATAVLNRQSPQAQTIAGQTKANVLWYAVDEPAGLSARVESMTTAGTRFVLQYAGQEAQVTTPLVGRYNVANHLAAAGLCLAAGLELPTVAAGLSSLTAIPGRLEKVGNQTDATVVVDYAHTDDALGNVLAALKPLCRGKLIVVFGCGGDRDKTKRPRMAKVAQSLADVAIVTNDNPRSEDPQAIIDDIMAGFDEAELEAITVEPDRETAIQRAIERAGADDVVLIAGKGHEDYQIIGDRRLHFSDREVAMSCLEGRR